MSQRGRNKVGRNDPCPCGSGRKYKKCHLAAGSADRQQERPDPAAYQRIRAELAKQVEAAQFQAPKPIKAEFKGHVFRAFRSHLFVRNRNESYQEWVIDVLKRTMGQGWLNKYKPPNQGGHPVKRWLYSWSALAAQHLSADHDGPAVGVTADGDSKALVVLAEDVYRLRQENSFPTSLRDRLRDPRQFQGARYEIAIAATFLRAGFDLEWQVGGSPDKRVEFLARQRGTNETVAVETKSRHRPGVLGTRGTAPSVEELHFDVHRLFSEALQQAPTQGIFAVFIDLNLPRVNYEEYLASLSTMLSEGGADATAVATLLVFTNWPWHYDGTVPASPGFGHFLEHQQPTYPFRDRRTVEVLFRELKAYGHVPPDL
jgi:hypothetical protein